MNVKGTPWDASIVDMRLQRAAAAAIVRPQPTSVEALEQRRLLSAGDLDPTFGRGGTLSLPHDLSGGTVDVATLADGSTLSLHSGGVDTVVVRRKPDGLLDRTFGVDGVVRPVLPANLNREPIDGINMRVDGQGRIVLLEVSLSLAALVRYTPDGMLDRTFGGGSGVVQVPVGQSLALDRASGQIIVAGRIIDSDIGNAAGVERLNADGAIDRNFGTNGLASFQMVSGVQQVAVRPDHSVVVLGGPVPTGGVPLTIATVLALTPAGRIATFGDAGAGTTTVPSAQALAIEPDGGILLAGWIDGPTVNTERNALTRLTPAGAIDTSFGNGGTVKTPLENQSRWDAVVVLSDGRILTAGESSVTRGDDFAGEITAARFLANGTLDPTFADGAVYTAESPVLDVEALAGALAVTPSGKIVLGGTLGDGAVLIRLNADGTNDSTYGAQGEVTGRYPGTGPLQFATTLSDGSILADGVHLDTSGALDEASFLSSAALYAGSQAIPLPDGRLLIGVDISPITAPSSFFQVERLLSDRTLDPMFGVGGKIVVDVSGSGAETLGARFATTPDGSIVIIARTSTGGMALTRLTPDGILDTTFGTGGRVLFASGILPVAMRSDEDLTASIQGLAVDSAGRILVAAIDDTKRSYVARLTPAGTLDDTFGGTGSGIVSAPLGAGVRIGALALTSDGHAVVLGDADGQSAFFVTALTADAGAVDPTFDTGGILSIPIASPGFARALLVETNGDIVAAGRTDATDDRGGDLVLARITAGGQLDSTFGQGGIVIDPVRERADVASLSEDAQGRLLVAGTIADVEGGGGAVFRFLGDSAGGNIAGTIYVDANQDGAHNAGEAPLAEWTVYVDSNGDGKFTPGEPSAVTGPDGTYRIANLAPGTYMLRDEPANGFYIPQASAARTAVVSAGATTSGQDFGHFNAAGRLAPVRALIATPVPTTAPTPTPTPTPTSTPRPTGPLGATVTMSVPASVVSGANVKGSAVVTITNDTQSTFNGATTVKLLFSTDAQADASDATAETLVKKVKLKAGQSKSLKVKFNKIPSSLADGAYDLLAVVSTGGAVSDVAVASGTTTIAASNVDLALFLPTTSPTTVVAGTKLKQMITLQNVGNTLASGAATITLQATPDASPGAAAQTLETAHLKVRLAPNASKTYRVTFKLPSGLAARSYTLAGSLSDAALGDANASNNTAQVAGALTVASG